MFFKNDPFTSHKNTKIMEAKTCRKYLDHNFFKKLIDSQHMKMKN